MCVCVDVYIYIYIHVAKYMLQDVYMYMCM